MNDSDVLGKNKTKQNGELKDYHHGPVYMYICRSMVTTEMALKRKTF